MSPNKTPPIAVCRVRRTNSGIDKPNLHKTGIGLARWLDGCVIRSIYSPYITNILFRRNAVPSAPAAQIQHVARCDVQPLSPPAAAAETRVLAQWGSSAAIEQPTLLRFESQTGSEGRKGRKRIVQRSTIPEHRRAFAEGQGRAGALCRAQRGAKSKEQPAMAGSLWYVVESSYMYMYDRIGTNMDKF
jgi:hypothetical protein